MLTWVIEDQPKKSNHHEIHHQPIIDPVQGVYNYYHFLLGMVTTRGGRMVTIITQVCITPFWIFFGDGECTYDYGIGFTALTVSGRVCQC